MKHPALKAISVLVSLGVVGFLVAQAGVAGCHSAANERPPASGNGANAASAASATPNAGSASAPTGTTNAANEPVKPSVEPPPPAPTYLPATKAGPVFPPAQQGTSGLSK
jgi:hypothetical protein